MMLRARDSSFERSNSTYGVVRAAVGQIGYERFRRNRVRKTCYCCLRMRYWPHYDCSLSVWRTSTEINVYAIYPFWPS
jgi:hypothetical protein